MKEEQAWDNIRHDKLVQELARTKAHNELVRLQKETHLFEHGFYDKEIEEWFQSFEFAEDGRSIKFKIDKDRTLYLNYFAVHGADAKIIKDTWFRCKFPEFFEEDK